MNSRWGESSGFESARARSRSKLFAYSNDERTPCLTVMLYVQSGLDAPGRSTRYSSRIGNLLVGRCSMASIAPGLTKDAPTKLKPTGSYFSGGSLVAA